MCEYSELLQLEYYVLSSVQGGKVAMQGSAMEEKKQKEKKKMKAKGERRKRKEKRKGSCLHEIQKRVRKHRPYLPLWRSETGGDGNGCATLPHQNLGA